MIVTDFTTYRDIRALLGVSDDELEDDTIALEVYSTNLSKEMRGVHAQVLPQYSLIREMDEEVRTDAQQQFYETARLFAAYAVAKQLCSSLGMFGPKDISDSKASVSRFSDSPYKTTTKEVKEQFTSLKTTLSEMIAALLSASGVRRRRTYLAISQPSTDPVIE